VNIIVAESCIQFLMCQLISLIQSWLLGFNSLSCTHHFQAVPSPLLIWCKHNETINHNKVSIFENIMHLFLTLFCFCSYLTSQSRQMLKHGKISCYFHEWLNIRILCFLRLEWLLFGDVLKTTWWNSFSFRVSFSIDRIAIALTFWVIQSQCFQKQFTAYIHRLGMNNWLKVKVFSW